MKIEDLKENESPEFMRRKPYEKILIQIATERKRSGQIDECQKALGFLTLVGA